MNNRTPPVVDRKLYERYLAHREKYGYGGRPALQHLHAEDALKMWEDTFDVPYIQDKAIWTEGAFTFQVRFRNEEDGSFALESIGKFVSKGATVPHLGTLRVEPWLPPRLQADQQHVYAICEHENAYDREWGGKRPLYARQHTHIQLYTTYNDHFRAYWHMGYRKEDCDVKARKNWHEDVRQMETYGDNGWWTYGLQVRVLYDLTGDGPEEIAESTNWGIDSRDKQDQLRYYVRDVSREALAEAKEYLEKLRKKMCATLTSTSVVK